MDPEARTYLVLILCLLVAVCVAVVVAFGALVVADRERRHGRRAIRVTADLRVRATEAETRLARYLAQRQRSDRDQVDNHFGRTVYQPHLPPASRSTDDTVRMTRINGHHQGGDAT